MTVSHCHFIVSDADLLDWTLLNFNGYFNPFNATGGNMQQVLMLSDNYGIEGINTCELLHEVRHKQIPYELDYDIFMEMISILIVYQWHLV